MNTLIHSEEVDFDLKIIGKLVLHNILISELPIQPLLSRCCQICCRFYRIYIGWWSCCGPTRRRIPNILALLVSLLLLAAVLCRHNWRQLLLHLYVLVLTAMISTCHNNFLAALKVNLVFCGYGSCWTSIELVVTTHHHMLFPERFLLQLLVHCCSFL